jgi:AhpD family alkylhydroperoxidase
MTPTGRAGGWFFIPGTLPYGRRVSGERVDIGKAAPGAYQGLIALSREVLDQSAAADLDPRLVELVKIRTSQINGCAYCLQMHTRDALGRGETHERLAVLPAWRETSHFSPVERAALALSEAITQVGDGQVTDEAYAASAAHLSDQQIAAVAWLTIVMNAFNRLAITSRYPVGPIGSESQ